jgi:hypothetical protein
MKKLTLTFFVCFLLNAVCFAQTSGPNDISVEDHNRFSILMNKSAAASLPDSVITQLKKFAVKINMEEQYVMRNQIILRPLYDNSLSREDRLFACKTALKMFSVPKPTVPIKIILDAQRNAVN